MSTIDDRTIIDRMIRDHGYYMDDPRVVQIVEYTNGWGKVTWGVTWSSESEARQRRYEIESEYVRNPRVIWRAI